MGEQSPSAFKKYWKPISPPNSSSTSSSSSLIKENGATNAMYHLPYEKEKLPPSSSRKAAERGWLETAFRMGVTRPELCLSKRVTLSDTKPYQHRFQLRKAEVEDNKLLRPLGVLAALDPANGVGVKVLDRMGNKYAMAFKCLGSSKSYRLMGRDYSEFLASTQLRENQVMDVWGLPLGTNRGNRGEIWLALVNSDDNLYHGDDDDDGGLVSEALPSVESWNVIL